jgi:type VI secretion system protein ImpG
MDDLLPYYERELGVFRQYAREFSERFPKMAGKLLIAGESCADPDVERLIESVALMSARISKRLDDDYPVFTESMLESLYPHYLRPLPSYSVVQFAQREGKAVKNINTFRRGTTLDSPPVRGVSCKFQTSYDVTLAPIAITQAQFQPFLDNLACGGHLPQGATAGIRLVIESTGAGFDLSRGKLAKLRVFIDGEPSLRAVLIDTLFIRAAGAYVQTAPKHPWIALEQQPLRLVGFDEDDALIPFSARSHPAFRLLTEYFSYPEKFNFIDIDLSELATRLPPECRSFSLQLVFSRLLSDSKEARLLTALTHRNFLLACTPVINLFDKPGVPVQLTHTSADYALLADATHADAYEIHCVKAVRLLRETVQGNSVTEFSPMYSVRHDEQGAHSSGNHWLTRRDDAMAAISPGHEVRISLTDVDFKVGEADVATLSTDLVCTNRDLATSLRYGQAGGDLTNETLPSMTAVRLLRKPSPPYRFDSSKGAHWRLISHLALNYSTLTNAGVADFQKMLTLYDLPCTPSSQRQIGGIVGLEHGTVRDWIRTLPVSSLMPGIGIRMTVDEQAFVGSSLYIFAQVLDRYFSLNKQSNCFTRFELISAQTGEEILTCQPRSAEQIRA